MNRRLVCRARSIAVSDGLNDPAASSSGAVAKPGQVDDGDATRTHVRGEKRRRRRRSRRRRSKDHSSPQAAAKKMAIADLALETKAGLNCHDHGTHHPSQVTNEPSERLSSEDGQLKAKHRSHRRGNREPRLSPSVTETTTTPLNAQQQRSHKKPSYNGSIHGKKNGTGHAPLSTGGQKAGANGRAPTSRPSRYAALDLGTNNCRLLVAEPREQGFRVVDAFSRIVRLGDGMAGSGALSASAMERAIDALKICGRKLTDNNVHKARLIATEACRYAENGTDFLRNVEDETGLKLEIVDRETEARLAVAGCASLVHPQANGVILFDIGGGSSELVWLDLRKRRRERGVALSRFIRAWTSLPVGVVTLSERFGGIHVTPDIFNDMVAYVDELMSAHDEFASLDEEFESRHIHLLGTSGTVTTLAGIHLDLPRYDRRRVDGLWMSNVDVVDMIRRLVAMDYDQRVENPCIGSERADLVLAGCAIFEAVRRRWPCRRIRVADRGLREGILMEMMSYDRVWSRNRSRGGKPKGQHHRHPTRKDAEQNTPQPSPKGHP